MNAFNQFNWDLQGLARDSEGFTSFRKSRCPCTEMRYHRCDAIQVVTQLGSGRCMPSLWHELEHQPSRVGEQWLLRAYKFNCAIDSQLDPVLEKGEAMHPMGLKIRLTLDSFLLFPQAGDTRARIAECARFNPIPRLIGRGLLSVNGL